MPSDNLDDLFRQQLGQHATPPSADLARRLAELAEAERLDTLFRTGLAGHASQPRRAVWERLEDEHLHPTRPRRRVVAWWQLSAAAVLLVSLLAGGLLWRGGRLAQPGGQLATHGPARSTTTSQVPVAPPQVAAGAAHATVDISTDSQLVAQTQIVDTKKVKKISASQATAPGLLPSSPPIATTTPAHRPAAAGQAASGYHRPHRALDAVPGPLASAGGQPTPAGQAAPGSEALPTSPAHGPTLLATAMTSEPEIVEVEVRRGSAPASPSPTAVLASVTPDPPPRRRLRLGGLLRQADHLVHGEPVSLAEVTGLAETVTVQARLGGRTLSRTIRL